MKLSINKSILSFAICLSAGTVTAQSFNKAKMDSFFTAIESNNKGMGSIALSKNGRLLYTKAIGNSYINGDTKIHADYATKYRIGSITKMFTATIIFQLIEEGKLTLKTPLDKYFPKVPNAKKITVGNLLNHRSGIHNFTNDSEYLLWNTKPHTQAEMLAIIVKGGSDFVPGSKAEYSNSNFVLLGYIVEKITGHSYKDELQKRIASKIGLTNTYYGGKISSGNHEAYSYTMASAWEQESETDMSIPGGAGAILSTPADLDMFIDALFTGKLVKKESLELMKTQTDRYGMGLFQVPLGSKKGYGHTGGIDGFSSSLTYFPDDSLAIAYCNNGAVMATNDIMIGALSIYFNKPYDIPTFKTVALSAATLNSYAGVYSSAQMPLKITVTVKGNLLYAQATGQGEFPLEAIDETNFQFTQAGIKMSFDATKNEMTLKQGGGSYNFTKGK